MDWSDLIPRHPNSVGASSPTLRSSPAHSSDVQPGPMTVLNTAHQPTTGPAQGQVQAVNEITPIVSSSSSPQRQYSATEEDLRNRGAGPGSQGGGLERTKTQGSRIPSRRSSQANTTEPQGTWYSRIADRYGSIELENKGSVARDHLALERTFLAWLRTSLAFASIGIAVTQLFRLRNTTGHTNGVNISSPLSPTFSDSTDIGITSASERLRSIGKPLGTTFIGVAILILLVGFHRYFESQHWIVRGKFPASRGSIIVVAFVAGALIVATLAVILVMSPGTIEN